MKSLNTHFETAQVPVLVTATLISAAKPGLDSITIQNLGTNPVYIGNSSSVAVGNGFPIPGVAGASITLPATVAIYGIASGGTQNVAVLKTL